MSYRTAKEGVRNRGFVCRGLTYSSDRYYALPTASYYTTTSLITTVSHDSCGGEVPCHPNNQSASLARVAARPELSKTTTLNRVSVWQSTARCTTTNSFLCETSTNLWQRDRDPAAGIERTWTVPPDRGASSVEGELRCSFAGHRAVPRGWSR